MSQATKARGTPSSVKPCYQMSCPLLSPQQRLCCKVHSASKGLTSVSNHSGCERIWLRANINNAAGPDNVPGHVLRTCANHLADVITDIFNISLSQETVSSCLKTANIIPDSKKVYCLVLTTPTLWLSPCF